MTDATAALARLIVLKAVSWVGVKAANLVIETTIDHSVGPMLTEYRKRAATWLRGKGVRYGFGDRPQATATNHDLLRALRAAWVSVARQKIRRIRDLKTAYMKTGEVGDWPGLELMADRLAEELRRLEMEAADRNALFHAQSPLEMQLLKIVEAVPEQVQGISQKGDAGVLTDAFVNGVLSLPVDFGPLRPQVEEILAEELIVPPQGRTLRPGEAILDQFVENLKSGKFPEAAQAFQFLLNGLIRQDVAERTDEIRGDLAEMHETIAKLGDDLAAGFDPAALQPLLREIARSHDEISVGIDRIRRDLQRLETIVGARKHDFIVTRDEVAERRRRLTTAFHGRHDELERLFGRFSAQTSGLTVIAAPAGTGKSAFMACAADLADMRGFAVAAHFISREHQRTFEPDDALGFTALQLRALGNGDTDDRRLDRDMKGLQDEIYRRLQSDYPAARPLIVFIDGLDELDGRLPFFIPKNGTLGANVHVVVSCRTSGPEDVPPVLRDWIGIEAARAVGAEPADLRFDLPPLDRTAIALWLYAELGSIENLNPLPLSDRLQAASDGLAIFLKFLIDDVHTALSQGETPDGVARALADLPAPFATYLKESVLQGERDGQPLYGPADRLFLGLLAAAYGPIAQAEVRALCSKVDVRNPPDAVRRWLAPASLYEGDGWTLQHPRLAAPFLEALDYEADDARRALSDHCRQTIAELPTRGGAYAARWGARHLLASEDRPTIEGLSGRFADPAFIRWRLDTVPTQQTLGLIRDDYDALVQRATGAPRRKLEEWVGVFVSLVPALSKEAEQ